MTGWEAVFFQRYGLEACLDWEVNQHLVSKVNGKAPEENMVLGLAMHFTVGIAIAVGFAWFAFDYPAPMLSWMSVAVAVVMWSLLLPMRRFATGNAAGWLSAAVSLVGHVIYGIVLAVAVIYLRGQ
jgi:hypothetical protein